MKTIEQSFVAEHIHSLLEKLIKLPPLLPALATSSLHLIFDDS